MSDAREIRHRCDVSDAIMMWNVVNRCKECRMRESSNNENEENEEIVYKVVDAGRDNIERVK